MPTILVDDFSGSGDWDITKWPYVQNQDEVYGFKAVRTRANGLGTTTNATKDYGYARPYFNTGERLNYGIHVKGRFRGATSGENVRLFVRAGRAGRNSGDWTFPATGLVVSLVADSTALEVVQLLNSNATTFSNVNIAAPGTNWWNVRVEVEDNQFRVRYWLDSQSEPTTWGRVGTLPGTFPAGEAGYGTGYRANQVMDFDFFSAYNFENVITSSGSIAARGTLGRRATKRLTGTVTAQGVLRFTRTVFRTFAGSISASGFFARGQRKTFAGMIAPTSSFRRANVRKSIDGVVPLRGVINFGFVRSFSGSITPVGTVAVKFIGRLVGRPGLIAASFKRATEIRAWFSERGGK